MQIPTGGTPPGPERDGELARFPLRVPPEAGTAHTLSRQEVLRARLDVLRQEHRQLDEAVAAIAARPGACALTLQRMKRHKLVLKDQIARIEDELTPDIIA